MSLTTKQVLENRKQHGWNEIVPSKMVSGLSEIKHILTDPMGLMLLCLGFIYLLVGQMTDAIVLFIAYIPVTAVDVLLELRTKKVLSALKASLNPEAKVIRDEMLVSIPIREIVPADVLVFQEGQSLPADGNIIECEQLQINEAALSGESLPVDKSVGDKFFAGTAILQGRGLGQVEHIARQTKFGKIAAMLEDTEAESSPLKKKINAMVKRLLIVALLLAIVLFVVTYLQNHNWTQSFILALTFGMAAIPEEFPIVFTLYLSMGAYRLSKHGVLVKSLPSVEALGGVDVICTDKTGTLTEGKFQLESLEPMAQKFSPELLWQTALMACEENVVDAMEVAIVEKGQSYLQLLTEWDLKWDNPFETKGKHMSHVWIHKNQNEGQMAMKGSVEGVLEHCHTSEDDRKLINERVSFWASKGKRILGLAYRSGKFTGNRVDDETNLEFIGLIIFSDPIRASAKNAVAKCQQSGISVKMLTGDHPITAHAIADELGIVHSHDYLFTGPELSQMPKEDRWKAYQQGAIFSRLIPEQKYEMVQALKSLGRVVAMTGDGINDAPALKTADIGISMGQNATDVARSSAQIVLLTNDFQGITQAIFEGKKIFTNLKRSFSYLISFHVPIILFALIPPLLGLGNLLLPIHIVLLQLVVHPVSAFSFENLPAPAASTDRSLMSGRRFFESFLSGILLSLVSFYLYRRVLETNDQIMARSVAIAVIMFGNIFFVLLESWPKLTMRFLLTAISLVIVIFLILYVEIIATTFHLTGISGQDMLIAIGSSVLATLPTFILRNKRA